MRFPRGVPAVPGALGDHPVKRIRRKHDPFPQRRIRPYMLCRIAAKPLNATMHITRHRPPDSDG
jgi:hypothetical protein